MHTPQELEQKLWKALKSDRTVMLGLDGVEDGHSRPMTVQYEEQHGPLWIFTSKDNALVQHLTENPESGRAIAAFVAKDHDLFASIHGELCVCTEPDVVDRLWNPFIAAWYSGKDDPKLTLLRFDAENAEIWLNDSTLLAGVKMLLGVDPKKSYRDKVAEVRM